MGSALSNSEEQPEEDVPCFNRATCLLNVIDGVMNLESLNEIKGRMKIANGNEIAEKEVTKHFGTICSELLMQMVNERIAECCLDRDAMFFKMCKGHPDTSLESDFWQDVLQIPNCRKLLNNAIDAMDPKKSGKLAITWTRNLHLLAPYFATEKAEKELFRTVIQWITSPDLTKAAFDNWKTVVASSPKAIRLIDLRKILANRSNGKLFEEFAQALEDIDTVELSSETSNKLYSYLSDVQQLKVEVKPSATGRKRLVVAQKVMFLSSIGIDKLLKEDIQEIHVYAKKLLFVDCDLSNDYMHGRNLAMASGCIVLRKKNAVFDVSGKSRDARLKPPIPFIPGEGQDGEDGKDGLAGESSGNISIVAGEIKNAEWLTVKLVGGNGEGGQTGGRGGDGKIGRGVTKQDLLNLCVSYGSIYFKSMTHFINHDPGNGFERTFYSWKNGKQQYLHYTYEHPDGRKIEYALAGENLGWWRSTRYHLYFVVHGAPGGSPGIGGRNGVSGEGGRRGDFVAVSMRTGRPLKGVEVTSQPGKDGTDGSCGQGGKPGMSGNDMALIDQSKTDASKFFIGSSGKDKLKYRYFYSQITDDKARFNGYYKYAKEDDECWVYFEEVRADPIAAGRTTEKRTSNERKSQSKAVSQQTILLENVVAEFNAYFDDDVEFVLEEITFDDVHIEEEEETEEQMQEELTVVRAQMEDVGAHAINAKTQVPKADEVLRRIKDPAEKSLVTKLELWKNIYSVCLDVRPVKNELEKMLLSLENTTTWEKESVNGFLSNGMSKKQFLETVRNIRTNWEDKQNVSTFLFTIDTKIVPSNELEASEYELHDVISVPLECYWEEKDSPQRRKELITSVMKNVAKYWMNRDVLIQINVIHKELKKFDVFDKFANDELDWSNVTAVKDHLKSFMSQVEIAKEEEEAEIAAEAMTAEEDQELDAEKKKGIFEKASNFVSKKWKEHQSQFKDVEALLKKRSKELDSLFEPLRKLANENSDLKDRFTLQLDIKGTPKPVGSHETSLIFMRYFSEKILYFSSELFRYHLKYRNAESTPTDWYSCKELIFNNYGEFMLALGKYSTLPIDRSFREHMESMGLRSASYRLLYAEKNDVNIQLFCESGYAKMRLVENNNKSAKTTLRLFMNRKGEVSSIAPNLEVRRLRAMMKSCSIDKKLPLSQESDLTSFVISAVKHSVIQWSEAVSTSTDSTIVLRFLRRLFDIRGFDLSLVELQFLLNTLVDCVCNHDVPLDKICIRLLGPHGKFLDLSLALRVMNAANGQCPSLLELMEKVSAIKDRRLQALFGSKLHEMDWNKYRNKLDLLVHMLSHAENCFSQLEDRPLKEWIDIAECQKWDSFEPLLKKYGTAGYFFILLDSAGRPEVKSLQLIVDELKKEGCILYEKLISRLTFLIYYHEVKFGQETQKAVREIFKKGSALAAGFWEKGREGIRMLTEERQQQDCIKKLKKDGDWDKVFPRRNRSLDELVKLSNNPQDTQEERKARATKMESIGRMITSMNGAVMEKLAKIDEVLEKKRNLKLRDTQKIAVLSGYLHDKNLLCQVNTGEGKSFIIAALAILKVTLDRATVDIITSSSVLAQRDAESMKDIYEAFDIEVGHNCDEDSEKRKKAYKCAVVYGDIPRFERDHLLHHFYKRNVLGDRRRDSVIVDEVDSMFLDNGSNMLYLSHNVPGLELLESLFVFLHKEVYTIRDGGNAVSMSARIRKAVLVDLFGMVTKDDIKQLLLHEKQTAKIPIIWRHLVKNNIVDNEGILQRASEKEIALLGKELLSSCGIHLTKRVLGMLTIVMSRKREIQIPYYLYDFVLQHLNEFVDNSLKGLFLKHNDEYVVDVDRSGRTGDLHPVVTIIDRGTGTDLSSSQWSEGLHQFLQLKHGCRLTALSLKAVFVSNVSYLKGYGKINGFSGTLGSKVESDSLRELYDADVMRIPTWKPKEFNENAPVLAKSDEEWITELYDEICDQFKAWRSVLLICKSIGDVKKLYKELNKLAAKRGMKNFFEKAILYQREFDEFDFDSTGGLLNRQLIISTNLAGRGTDIKLHDDLVESGGLHVIVSFLPENSRIEDQAYGRAARCGQPGSGQIIALLDEHASGASNIFQLKQFRDNAELHRLRSLKQFYDYHIDVEETCLRMFQEHSSGALSSIYAVSEDSLPSSNQVVYFALLDEWAMWLDGQADRIKRCEKNASQSEKLAIIQAAEKFFEDHPISKDWKHSLGWLKRPQPLLTLAQIKLNQGKMGEAQEMLTRIADEFPDFSAEAYYYMAVIVQKLIRELKEFKREESEDCSNRWFGYRFRRWVGEKMEDVQNWGLRQVQKWGDLEDSPDYFVQLNEEYLAEATTLFLKSRAQFMRRIRRKKLMNTIVTKLQQGGVEASSRGYANQQEESIAVWESLIGNIDDILGHVPKPENVLGFGEQEYVSIGRMRALRHAGIISPIVLADEIDEDSLIPVANSSCLPILLLADLIYQIKNSDVTEYEGRKVVDVNLLENLPLPSAIGFWGCLRRAGCFLRERFYIAVRKNTRFAKMKSYKPVVPKIDPFDMQLTDNGMEEYDLYDVHDEAGKVKEDPEDNATLRELMECGEAYMEIIGTLNPLVVTVEPTLDQFDFISVHTLVDELGVDESEAKWILKKLVDTNVLKETIVDVEEGLHWKWQDREGSKTVGTGCMTVFLLESRIDLEEFPENIRDSLGTVFARHFSYGYALRGLISSVQEAEEGKTVRHRVLLPSNPYSDLYEEMLSSGVLMHGRVTNVLKTLYSPEDPTFGETIDFLPSWLFEKLQKLTPWITVNTCKLRFTQEYMREKCVPASAEIRSALANGMRQVAFITEPNRWRWFFGVFYDIANWLCSCAVVFIGNMARSLALLVTSPVGSMQYFMSLMKENQRVFAKTDVSVHEEFMMLRSSHEVAVQRMNKEKKMEMADKRIHKFAAVVTDKLRKIVLCHCLLTDCRITVTRELLQLIRECINNSQLLPMLRQTIEAFLSSNTRSTLNGYAKVVQNDQESEEQFEASEMLLDVAAFGTTIIIDVNRATRLQNQKKPEKIIKFDPNVIKRSCINEALEDMDQLEMVLRNKDNNLQSVLAREMHSVLEDIVEQSMKTTVQPIINQISEAWREKNASIGGELKLDDKSRQKKSAEYSAERLAKAHTSDFMERDLQNIFLKMTFREQRPAVLCHMIRYNYPLSAHCARKILEAVLGLLDDMKIPLRQLDMSLLRKKDRILALNASKQRPAGKVARISLSLKEDCFYATDPDNYEKATRKPCGLFETLCVEIEEIATEFSLGADVFQSRLEKIVQNAPKVLDWKIEEKWTANEKLLCPVPF